jgi:hypothetical protein
MYLFLPISDLVLGIEGCGMVINYLGCCYGLDMKCPLKGSCVEGLGPAAGDIWEVLELLGGGVCLKVTRGIALEAVSPQDTVFVSLSSFHLPRWSALTLAQNQWNEELWTETSEIASKINLSSLNFFMWSILTQQGEAQLIQVGSGWLWAKQCLELVLEDRIPRSSRGLPICFPLLPSLSLLKVVSVVPHRRICQRSKTHVKWEKKKIIFLWSW